MYLDSLAGGLMCRTFYLPKLRTVLIDVLRLYFRKPRSALHLVIQSLYQ